MILGYEGIPSTKKRILVCVRRKLGREAIDDTVAVHT